MTMRQPLINHRGKPTLSDKPAIEANLRERIDDGSGLFFTGQKGRLTRWALDKMFRSYCQQVSSARVSRGEQAIPEEAQRFHAIKHTGVTFVAQGSKDLLATKDWAGHASISSTMIYAHPDTRQTAQYAQSALGNAFAMAK
jgi:site-specific recombinase XerC